jgi:hypothetical protein
MHKKTRSSLKPLMLALHAETLVHLTRSQLERVAGGAKPPTQATLCGTGCDNTDFVCH